MIIREKNIKLAIKWMSPEVLRERRFSEGSDIWAAGVTAWEILAYGELPYKDKNNAETQKAVVAGFRLPKPPGALDPLWLIIESMWAEKSGDRGTFKDLGKKLENLVKRNKKVSQQSDVRAFGQIVFALLSHTDLGMTTDKGLVLADLVQNCSFTFTNWQHVQSHIYLENLEEKAAGEHS